MSREDLLLPENLPERWYEWKSLRDGLKSFRINLLILKNNWRWIALTAVPVLFVTVALFEARTSVIEAKILSHVATSLSYTIGNGPSPRITFPSSGPFNDKM